MSYLVYAFVMAKRMKREDCLTLSEVIDKSYGGHACGTIYAVINCGAAISIMAGQIVAGKNLFQYLGLNPFVGAALCAVVVFIYAFLCAGTLVMVVGGIFWKKATKTGAIASSIVGMFFVVLYKFCGVTLPFASIFPILPSLITFVIVSLCTQSKDQIQKI